MINKGSFLMAVYVMFFGLIFKMAFSRFKLEQIISPPDKVKTSTGFFVKIPLSLLPLLISLLTVFSSPTKVNFSLVEHLSFFSGFTSLRFRIRKIHGQRRGHPFKKNSCTNTRAVMN